MNETPQSYGRLALVLFGLLLLTALTVIASRVNLGAYNIWLALAIAALKSSLVLMFFMHLRHASPLIRRGFLTTLLVMVIMIGFVFLDTAFRGGLYVR